MRIYSCRVCGNRLYFENSVCVRCGTGLGYSRDERDIVPVDGGGRHVDGAGIAWHVCRNLGLSGCTWLTTDEGGQCTACDLTRTRPHDGDAQGLAQFPVAERAKRQLVAELDRLGFRVVSRADDPGRGLCFDMLSSVGESVVIGHADGVITIDLAEADASHRVRVRDDLGEPYRTMIGHLRHESGHYFQWLLVQDPALVERGRALFGDETADYSAAIGRHYAEGPPADWRASYISAYATMHPFEDFAETWAHFLHIRDTIESAAATGLITVDPSAFSPFSALVTRVWMPLSLGLNLISRSLGDDDLYPFVIPAPVLDKLDFVAALRPSPA
ncbi:putative zinc-binding metallopeptidase [Microbacterium betulae]|uniref:Zinc-binding metallopeptidase n=1 Tax=Microbacterium betulae TaxID=2981139 RepID=A0AA97I6N1_9MICO|nr:putative zinc-binding metallopeptidase [Microbacterium sp. AB]WOF23322.1 putative zinc-binding metallopeptidase [Microbacterium sp. AB]